MASFDTLLKLREHPEWIAPRSDVRVFLGEPGAPEATKTTVEPGNTFSPGMRTFGVTWWLRFPDDGTFFAPEITPLEDLKWRFEGGYLPLVHCETAIGGLEICHSLFQDGVAAERSEAVCGQIRIENTRPGSARVQLFVALRSLGPAGGPLSDLKVGADGRSFWLARRDLPLLGVDQSPSAIGCGVGDPSPLAREGQVPSAQAVDDLAASHPTGERRMDEEEIPTVPLGDDPVGWCFGLARFDITIDPGERCVVHLDCPQQTYGAMQNDLPGTASLRPEQYETRAQAHLANWQARLSHIELDVPDPDFRNAFFANLQHMLVALVGDQVRLAPLAYPLPWLRDSVYIMRCFDLAGWPDLARATTEICVRHDFFGGFCAEADGPGQGVWALVEHYRITRDRVWLERVYPTIQRKCEWLFRMRRAKAPIQLVPDTPILPFMHAQRNASVICVAAQDGVIMGVMDLNVEVGIANHWALCGLQEAAYAARELGHESDAQAYETEAEKLRAALIRYVERNPQYFEWDRTGSSLVWPTRAWEHAPERVAPGFEAWWQKHRGGPAEYIPEQYWLHFELGQVHNALLLGLRDRAWLALKYRLEHQDIPGLYGWREYGPGTIAGNAVNGVSLIKQLRGCQRFESITPHGWCASEMWLLQRGMLVEEWQGGLLLFAGVPREWLAPGVRVAFRDFPTWYGKANAELLVDAQGRLATITLSGVAAGTPVRISLPGRQVDAASDRTGALSTEVKLW